MRSGVELRERCTAQEIAIANGRATGLRYRDASGVERVQPAGAVVVPGTRPVRSGVGRERGISLYAPVIVKYRDDRTDASVQLEALLR